MRKILLGFVFIFLYSFMVFANAPRKGAYLNWNNVEGFINQPNFQRFHICFKVTCLKQTITGLSAHEESVIRKLFAQRIDSPAKERALISKAIGIFEYYVSRQPSINTWRDKGKNWSAGGAEGHFAHDCIDKSNNVTSFLLVLQEEGLLQFHKVLPMSRRFFNRHFAATIEEFIGKNKYIVDSWFLDNGYPAVVLPFKQWKKKEEKKYYKSIQQEISIEYKNSLLLPLPQFKF